MLSIGALSFLYPWLLVALIILPVLWHIIRFTPPTPRTVKFPAVKLLRFIKQKEETPMRSPWWLILLRLLALSAVILAAAWPVWNPAAKIGGGNAMIVVVDNGWSAARAFPRMEEQLEQLLSMAEREKMSVTLITTAPTAESGNSYVSNALSYADAARLARAIRPQPWATKLPDVVKQLETKQLPGNATIHWLSDGIDHDGFDELAAALSNAGNLLIYQAPDLMPHLLTSKLLQDGSMEIKARRVANSEFDNGAQKLNVIAEAADGRIIGRGEIEFAPDQPLGVGKLTLPTDLRNDIARLQIENENSAAAVFLLDESAKRRPVGLVATQAVDNSKPLLDENYFIERALNPFSEVHRGALEQLLQSNMAVIVQTDGYGLNPTAQQELERWVSNGGTLIRFAGENLAQNPDRLVPTPIRQGSRSLGGKVSWSSSLKLSEINKASPFAGLEVPPDITITKQVLAEPSMDLADKTWVQLEDGTPLVTGGAHGKGWIVLFHVTGNTVWSNLPLSGLFVEMLQRSIMLSQGITQGADESLLYPQEVLDGFGQMQAAGSEAKPIEAALFEDMRASPTYPPGLYGTTANKRAFNLGSRLPALSAMKDAPKGAVILPYGGSAEKDLRGVFFLIALLLMLIDTVISLNLRGFMPSLVKGASVILILAMPLAANAQTDEIDAVKNLEQLRLAYVITGNAKVDRISEAGLFGLSQVIAQRTAIEIGNPVGVNIGSDELAYYPLLYWPSAPGQAVNYSGVRRVNAFLRQGGMILIDTQQGGLNAMTEGDLGEIFGSIDIPALQPMPQDHVLTRSFYLLKEWPGRYQDNGLWVASDEAGNFDGVSPVIVGGQDFAAAWATDKDGNAMFMPVPGGERQREMARRFGINLIMYALTGNYKSDQVHVPAILERIGK